MTQSLYEAVNGEVYKCYYCGIKYLEKVECCGVNYCPNPLCTGPGGAWFRVNLKSCKETSKSPERHTVDHEEWLQKGLEYIEQKDYPKDIKDFIINHAKTHPAFKDIKPC